MSHATWTTTKSTIVTWWSMTSPTPETVIQRLPGRSLYTTRTRTRWASYCYQPRHEMVNGVTPATMNCGAAHRLTKRFFYRPLKDAIRGSGDAPAHLDSCRRIDNYDWRQIWTQFTDLGSELVLKWDRKGSPCQGVCVIERNMVMTDERESVDSLSSGPPCSIPLTHVVLEAWWSSWTTPWSEGWTQVTAPW
jgi:predicted Fe-S protein YdhL (DUF1289 family)